jgi:hypothetical protein
MPVIPCYHKSYSIAYDANASEIVDVLNARMPTWTWTIVSEGVGGPLVLSYDQRDYGTAEVIMEHTDVIIITPYTSTFLLLTEAEFNDQWMVV